eukprot:c8013_g1_i1.p1 GENE.c8013_g1_i1~~c8013_g1_i1.p1  ORF type:complete len:749 (-),score=199.64 c8013_g1_i1:193-2175(-)
MGTWEPSSDEKEHFSAIVLLIRMSLVPGAGAGMTVTNFAPDDHVVTHAEIQAAHFLHNDLRAILTGLSDPVTFQNFCCSCHKYEVRRGFKRHPENLSTVLWVLLNNTNPVKMYFEYLKGQADDAVDNDDEDVGEGVANVRDICAYFEQMEYSSVLPPADKAVANRFLLEDKLRALCFADFVKICVEANCNCVFLTVKNVFPWTPNQEESAELNAVLSLAIEVTRSSKTDEKFLSAPFLSPELRQLIATTLEARKKYHNDNHITQSVNLVELFFNSCHKHQMITQSNDFACLLHLGPSSKEFFHHLTTGTLYEDSVSTRRVLDFLDSLAHTGFFTVNEGDKKLIEKLRHDLKTKGERQLPFLEYAAMLNDCPGNVFLSQTFQLPTSRKGGLPVIIVTDCETGVQSNPKMGNEALHVPPTEDQKRHYGQIFDLLDESDSGAIPKQALVGKLMDMTSMVTQEVLIEALFTMIEVVGKCPKDDIHLEDFVKLFYLEYDELPFLLELLSPPPPDDDEEEPPPPTLTTSLSRAKSATRIFDPSPPTDPTPPPDDEDEDSGDEDEEIMGLRNTLSRHESLGKFMSQQAKQELRRFFELCEPDDQGMISKEKFILSLNAMKMKLKGKSAKSLDETMEAVRQLEADKLDFRRFSNVLGSADYFAALETC